MYELAISSTKLMQSYVGYTISSKKQSMAKALEYGLRSNCDREIRKVATQLINQRAGPSSISLAVVNITQKLDVIASRCSARWINFTGQKLPTHVSGNLCINCLLINVTLKSFICNLLKHKRFSITLNVLFLANWLHRQLAIFQLN